MKLHKVCRICLYTSEDMVSFQNEVSDNCSVKMISALEHLLNVDLKSEPEHYPKQLCPYCNEKVQSIYDLRQRLKLKFLRSNKDITLDEVKRIKAMKAKKMLSEAKAKTVSPKLKRPNKVKKTSLHDELVNSLYNKNKAKGEPSTVKEEATSSTNIAEESEGLSAKNKAPVSRKYVVKKAGKPDNN